MSNLSLNFFIIVSIVLGQFISISVQFSVPKASSEADVVNLQEIQRQDRACFQKFDSFLAKLWEGKLNETNISDLGTIPEFWSLKKPSKPKYNTNTQEWLMDDVNPTLKLRNCSASLYESVSNKLDKETRACSDKLFKKLIDDEEKYAVVTEELLNDEKDLPFQEFLSFFDIETVVYQNRSYDNLTSHEQNVYGHMESFVPSEEDKNETAWILRQECNWENLKELREAKDDEHLLDLFKNQTLRSVDYVLGNSIVRNIDLRANISQENFSAWMEARKNMLVEIENIVEKLKSVKKDSQWICEYATEIGNKFAMEQLEVLLSRSYYNINLKTFDIVIKAQSIEKRLENLNDKRKEYFSNLAIEFDNRMHCMTSVKTMLTDHQSYELATSFIGNDLSYPQIFCRQMNLNLGLLAPMYCKCIGTFCVSHDIAALFSERLELEKNESSGIYGVITTNINRPTQKVTSWPGVKEI